MSEYIDLKVCFQRKCNDCPFKKEKENKDVIYKSSYIRDWEKLENE